MSETLEDSSPDRDQAAGLLVRWVREQAIPQESPEWQACSSLARELVWTCLRHKGILDGWTDHLSHQPPGKRIRPYLWLGLAQIFLMDGIPEHAAVHETVESAKRQGVPKGQVRFINAILRNALRRKEGLFEWWDYNILEKRYSHPGFLIDRWLTRFGEERTVAMLEWNQDRAHTYARRTRTGQKMEFPQDLDLMPFPTEGSSEFYQVPRKFNPADLPEFQNGAWYIQDPATAIAPELLNAQPGETVLDACAAPGGKTGILVDALGMDTHSLWAIDPQERRVKRLKENMNRLGAEHVHVRACEPKDLHEEAAGTFDAILLDVPCSNTGVLQRRPDAKWSLTPKTFAERATLQFQILEDSLPLLAPGGRMVYSTCCIEPEETSGVIERFCAAHPEWRVDKDVLCLPGEQETDGAYACLLVRKD
jgi:16S rRNA (cytosine967-C5)-methyltransferase